MPCKKIAPPLNFDAAKSISGGAAIHRCHLYAWIIHTCGRQEREREERQRKAESVEFKRDCFDRE